jgi:hypothetical protein
MILRSPTEHENGWMCLYFLALLWRERIEVRVVCALHGDPHAYPLPQAGEGVSEFCGSCIAAVRIFEGDTKSAKFGIFSSGPFVSFVPSW